VFIRLRAREGKLGLLSCLGSFPRHVTRPTLAIGKHRGSLPRAINRVEFQKNIEVEGQPRRESDPATQHANTLQYGRRR
jgi:hypothetical protein